MTCGGMCRRCVGFLGNPAHVKAAFTLGFRIHVSGVSGVFYIIKNLDSAVVCGVNAVIQQCR